MNFEPLLKVAPFSGIRVKPFDGTKRYLSTGDLQDDSLSFVDVTFEDKPSRADISVQKGDVLFARMKGTKKVLQVTHKLADIIVSTGFAVLRPSNDCDPRYLTTYLSSDYFERQKEKFCSGAIQPAITNGGIGKLQIPLPPLKDQIRIANLLGKVEAQIVQRKKNLQQLDDLLESLFLKMFHGHITSGKNSTLGTYITTLTDYHANGSYETLRKHVQLLTEPNYALMVRTTDLENKNFSDGCNYITKEAYDFLGKSKVYGSEIIVNKIGSAGKVYLMPNLDKPVSLGMNAFLLRFNEDLNNIFAYHFLTSDIGGQRIQKLVKGAVTKTITKDAIRSIVIPVVPLDRQNEFAMIAEKVEILKARYQQSLTDLEALQGALSQEAFKGELDLSRVPLPGIISEEDNAVVIEPSHAPAEEGIAINLPETDILLDALENAEIRRTLITQWLEAYCAQLGDKPFSVQRFMTAAQTRLAELHTDDDFELGVNDYEHIKTWVFEALTNGYLQQSRDITGHDERGKPIFGNLLEIKSGAQS